MRYVYLALVAGLIPSTGCAGLIRTNGTNIETFKTRTEVEQAFGSPVSAGTENGQSYEAYRTRRKISEWRGGEGYFMLDAVTLGLAELYLLPVELVKLTRYSTSGRTLSFTYDEEGNIKRCRYEGGPWLRLEP